MDKKIIQQQIDALKATPLANLSDAQLRAINEAMARHGPERTKKVSKTPRIRAAGKRKTKLTLEQAVTIRATYVKFMNGRKKIAKEYGVSVTTILKILRNEIFKT
jgi:DNA invertase Pin-like site-specific DNA recombinase